MYLLDTDVIIDFFRGDTNIVKNLIKKKNSRICISTLTLCELYKGAFLSNNSLREQDNIKELSLSTKLTGLDHNACKLFGQLNAELKKSGRLTQEIDLMIACIALSENLVLVTRNTKHFENISGLKIEAW